MVDRTRLTPRRKTIAWGPIARHIVLAVFAIITLFPFLWILLLSVKSLPVALSTGSGGMVAWSWPRLAAVYVMVILPGLLAFAIAQRWYVKGLQEGALKM